MSQKPEIIFTVLRHENSKFTPLGPKRHVQTASPGRVPLSEIFGRGSLSRMSCPELFLFGTGALLSIPAQPQASFLTTCHFW